MYMCRAVSNQQIKLLSLHGPRQGNSKEKNNSSIFKGKESSTTLPLAELVHGVKPLSPAVRNVYRD